MRYKINKIKNHEKNSFPKGTKVCAIIFETPTGKIQAHLLSMHDEEEITDLLTTNELE